MVRAATAAFAAVLFSASYALAQDVLMVGQPVEVAITAGAAHEYTIALDAGDYVQVLSISAASWFSRPSSHRTGRASETSAGLGMASGRSRSSQNPLAIIGSSCVRRRLRKRHSSAAPRRRRAPTS